MGVPWVDCHKVAKLIGTKVMLNEFMAYVDLVELKRNNDITKRAEIIATFALCGFSNISNIGTVLGSLGAMAPHRKGEMATIVVKAITAANVASFLTACVAGTLFSSLEYEESYFDKINTTSMQYHST
ncbi:Sodium/nucleoside cotransporter 1 [Armadillidium vulgare]|uniref:Sodium/nucleoside cotransporter 1 n=1 Tax=Armadillidium nasatum TaxID=96803 RepID=A0A5N5TNK9_9CRUS|nr:Sodium/nucleoside cotransporter 1 [Armadillidium nasatum]RXG58172.1 Sodium/nucleoside cotransporter 1 [Armadillidium vulgare]